MSDFTYEHFVRAADQPSAGILAGSYQQAGYIATARWSDAYEGWLVMVYAGFNADTHVEDCAAVRRIAERHGAEYDGGGCYVGPLRQLSP